MSTLPVFYVGEQPTSPLVITVTNEDGTPRDLADYESVSFIGEGMPDGTTTVSDPAEGKVQFDFAAPFTVAENLTLQIGMESGDIYDYSAPFVISVLDVPDESLTIVTPAQVEATTGESVTRKQVVKAQGLVSLAVGRDLTDQVWFTGYVSARDQFWLRTAVSYQASHDAELESGDTLSVPYAPGVATMSTGDQSITYIQQGARELGQPELVANAWAAIKHLSWMRPVRTIHAKPFLRGMTPEEAAAVVVGGFGYRA